MSKNNFAAKLAALKNRKIAYYCHFNKKTGEIVAVTNNTKMSNSYFEVSKDIMDAFNSGKKRADEHYVKFNTSNKTFDILQKKDYIQRSIKDILYEIRPTQDAEVVITKDYQRKKWIVSVDKTLNIVYNGGVVIDQDFLYFSVTSKKDPHYLFRTINVNLKSLLDNNIIEVDFDNCDLNYKKYSVYTSKKLDSYSIEEVL